MHSPFCEQRGRTTWTREPSGSRLSNREVSAVMRLFVNCAMLRAADSSEPSSAKTASVRVTSPERSMYMSEGPLIMISETAGSSRYACTGSRNLEMVAWKISFRSITFPLSRC